ncbi:hypothetical protein [Pontibacter fetidus]|uniref:Uncharacterized protein n=1 Tax=Pontibacter fetidus TaxID=2700082 RepID=A0A6B2HCI8_9BACT|nr:hypothetical protein [Pontibacter fetidus]NDK57514.1 hypothetical protein [Pontibacter fetidus]
MKRSEFVEKGTKIKIRYKPLNGLINNTFTVILKNWVFQGFFDLSINEKIYKILFDIIGVTIAYYFGIQDAMNLIIVFLFVHTVNWVTNDHFVDNLYHLQVCKTTPEKMEAAIKYLINFTHKYDSIVYAGIYGRIARGDEVHSGTDIDIRLLKNKGLVNSIFVCFIGHYLRFMGLVKLIPIDLNIWNSPTDLLRMRKDENPLIIKDEDQISKMYAHLPNNMLVKYKRYDKRHIK